MPGQQQQQLKRPIAERHDKRDRDKDIVQLQEERWANFASLDHPSYEQNYMTGFGNAKTRITLLAKLRKKSKGATPYWLMTSNFAPRKRN